MEELTPEMIRESMGRETMVLMDAVDEDYGKMLQTFTEHVFLMHKELIARGLDPIKSGSVIISYVVSVIMAIEKKGM